MILRPTEEQIEQCIQAALTAVGKLEKHEISLRYCVEESEKLKEKTEVVELVEFNESKQFLEYSNHYRAKLQTYAENTIAIKNIDKVPIVIKNALIRCEIHLPEYSFKIIKSKISMQFTCKELHLHQSEIDVQNFNLYSEFTNFNFCHIKNISFTSKINAPISNSIVLKCVFANGKHCQALLLDNVRFIECPTFSNSSFSNRNVNFHNLQFADKESPEAIGFFRSIKHACEEAGYEHGVIMFHGFELETYYNAYLHKKCPPGQLPEKFASLFHKWFTDYGRNLTRPLLWLVTIFTLPIIFACYDDLCVFSVSNFSAILERCKEIAKISLRNTLGPLALALPENIRKTTFDGFWLNLFSFLQITISSGIWFVFFFMIRRRFKL